MAANHLVCYNTRRPEQRAVIVLDEIEHGATVTLKETGEVLPLVSAKRADGNLGNPGDVPSDVYKELFEPHWKTATAIMDQNIIITIMTPGVSWRSGQKKYVWQVGVLINGWWPVGVPRLPSDIAGVPIEITSVGTQIRLL